MNNKPQIEKALPAKKTLSHIIKPKHNIEQARAHLLGVCLLDSSYVYYLPATIHFTEYGAFTLSMIKQGIGLEAIVRHLQAVGLENAQEILSSAFVAIPDGVSLPYIFWSAVQVLSDQVAIA